MKPSLKSAAQSWAGCACSTNIHVAPLFSFNALSSLLQSPLFSRSLGSQAHLRGNRLQARSCYSVVHSSTGQELLLCGPFLHGPGSIFHTFLHLSFCKQWWWWPQSYGGQWVKRRKWEGKIVAKTLISCVFLRKPPGTGRTNRFSNYCHCRLLRVALSDNIPRVLYSLFLLETFPFSHTLLNTPI